MAGGRIQGITVEIGGDTTKLSTALQQVNKDIKGTQSSLKDVNKLLKLDPGNTDLLVQKHQNLQKAVEATKQKLQTLKTAQEQAKQALENGTISQEQYDALQREIIATEQDLKNLETQANQSATALQKIAEAGDKVKSAGDKISGVGKTLTTTVTAPIVAAGTVAATKFAEVDKTMQLTNATMGNSAEQAALLDNAMKTAAANSTFGMGDAANASLNFARAGLKAEQAANALAPAMNLAAGEGGDLDTVSGGLVATINGFHGSFEEAGHYADVFASACNNSALDVNSLSGAMSVAAPIFSSAGYNVNDAALYMGVMANNGISADVAANSLKTGLARLVSPAKEGAEMMDQLGISITNSDGSMKSSVQVQSELHTAFSKLSESEQIAAASAIFGKNQMAPWLALINTAPEDVQDLDSKLFNASFSVEDFSEKIKASGTSIDGMKSNLTKLGISSDDFDMALNNCGGDASLFADLLAETADPGVTLKDVTDNLGISMGDLQKVMSSTSGTTDEMAKAMMSGFGGSIEQLKSSVDVLMVSLGQLLAQYLTPVIAKLQEWVNKINSLSPGMQNLIVKVALIAAAIGPLLIVIGKVMTGVGSIMTWAPKIGSAIAGVKTALTGLHAVMAANPIAVVVLAIAALVAIFVHLWNTSEGFRNFWIGLWNQIKTIATTVGQALATFFTTLWTGISTFFTTIWTGIKTIFTTAVTAIKTTITTVFTAISTFFTTIWTGIKTIFTTALTAIQTAVTTVFTAISVFFTTIWTGIKTIVTTAVTAIQTVITTVFTAISLFFTTIWTGIKTIFTTALTAIKTAITTVFTAIATFFTTVWTGIKTAVTTIVNAMKTALTTAFNAMKTAITTVLNGIKAVFTTVWNGIKTTVTTIGNGIKTAATTAFNGMLNGIRSACGRIAGVVRSGFSSAVGYIRGLAGQAVSWGRDIINGIVRGIQAMLGAVRSAVSNVANTIRSFLHFSVPDEGPLTDYQKWMPDFMGGLTKGIEQSRGMVKSAMEHVASDMSIAPTMQVQAAVAGGGSVPVNTADAGDMAAPQITIQQMTVRSDDDIRQISQELNTLMQRGRKAKGKL